MAYSAAGEDRPATLYELLRAAPAAAFADLRLGYRIRRLELSAAGLGEELRAIERAFNLLMHPELRYCYDALLRDADSPAIFPYGGGGRCLVSSGPTMARPFSFGSCSAISRTRHTEAFERPCAALNFMTDMRCTGTAARKAKIYVDPRLLLFGWDPTWNQWKHLVGSTIGVSTLRSIEYATTNGIWSNGFAQQVIYYGAGSCPRTDH
jgi:hypothetical protein